ncbi:MAG: hypothetical protein N2442_01265 [Spirochaetes bacterium]|nr:hypothetical protein [Spirochaetota bacterium]
MTCRDARDLYCSLDQGEPFPLELETHVSTCPSCTQWIQQMDWVFQTYRKSSEYPVPSSLENRILSAIDAMEVSPASEPRLTLSPGKWMLPGVFLILGIMGIPFSTVFSVFASLPGRNLEIVVPLVLGTAFTTYAAFFTGYNLEWLKKKFLT